MFVGPVKGGLADDVDAVEEDPALVRLLEAGDHPQRRGLAAPARAEQSEERAAVDLEVQVAHRHEVAEALGDARAPTLGPPSSIDMHRMDYGPRTQGPSEPKNNRVALDSLYNRGRELKLCLDSLSCSELQYSVVPASRELRGEPSMATKLRRQRATPSTEQRAPGPGASATSGCTSRGWASYADHDVPIIVEGDGCYVYDEHGKRYLDGLSALFCVNAGHGRAELGEPRRPRRSRSSASTRTGATPTRAPIELAARIAAWPRAT